jgi:phage shock protein C
MVGGVCGGLGKYFGIDATILRLIFVLLVFGSGVGVLIYLILWLVVPAEGGPEGADTESNIRMGADEIAARAREMGEDLRVSLTRPNPQAGLIIGLALIVMGGFFLIQNLGFPWLRWLNFDYLWPLLLIAGGLILLLRRPRGG